MTNESIPIYSSSELRAIILRHAERHRQQVLRTAAGFFFAGALFGWVLFALCQLAGIAQ